MSLAQLVPLADGWGMHNGNGWWILGAAVMMVFMGGMMWMMMRGMGGGSSAAPPQTPAVNESPLEILERRFAEGDISAEDYRARREMLVNENTESNGSDKDEALITTGAPEGKRR